LAPVAADESLNVEVESEMNQEPLVSVIIAVYNEERHIGECIQSLLAQSYPAVEILVVDDGSTDRTPQVVRGFPAVRYLRREHEGKARAVNYAADQASGEVLFFLDGDMVFDREYVAQMAAPILAGDCVGACHTEEYVANPANRWSSCLQTFAGLPRERRLILTPEQRQQGSTVFRAIRTDVFRRVGGFTDRGYEDDRTLYPKVGVAAQWVDGAVCHHYNVETLREVFGHGVWLGKSLFHRHGAGHWFRLLSPRLAYYAVAKAVTNRNAFLPLYHMTSQAGKLFGLAKMALGVDRCFGA
jgi:glycosyltransferase involved in cell wall biosynthesis